jgi:hypothetical protein
MDQPPAPKNNNSTPHHLDVGTLDVEVGSWLLYPTPEGPLVCRCVWGPEVTVFAEGYRYDSAQSPTSSAFAAARLRR